MAAPPPNLKVAITIHVAFERTVLKYAGLYDDTFDRQVDRRREPRKGLRVGGAQPHLRVGEHLRGGGLGVRFGCGVTFVCQCQYMSCVYLMSGDSLEI